MAKRKREKAPTNEQMFEAFNNYFLSRLKKYELYDSFLKVLMTASYSGKTEAETLEVINNSFFYILGRDLKREEFNRLRLDPGVMDALNFTIDYADAELMQLGLKRAKALQNEVKDNTIVQLQQELRARRKDLTYTIVDMATGQEKVKEPNKEAEPVVESKISKESTNTIKRILAESERFNSLSEVTPDEEVEV